MKNIIKDEKASMNFTLLVSFFLFIFIIGFSSGIFSDIKDAVFAINIYPADSDYQMTSGDTQFLDAFHAIWRGRLYLVVTGVVLYLFLKSQRG